MVLAHPVDRDNRRLLAVAVGRMGLASVLAMQLAQCAKVLDAAASGAEASMTQVDDTG